MNLLSRNMTADASPRLEWINEPPEWRLDEQGRLHVTPAAETDFFRPIDRPGHDSAGLLGAPAAHLRLTRQGDLFGMHYSLDGQCWRFVRAFGMTAPAEVLVGVHAQAPFVGGCQARFDHLEIDPQPVADFRSGE